MGNIKFYKNLRNWHFNTMNELDVFIDELKNADDGTDFTVPSISELKYDQFKKSMNVPGTIFTGKKKKSGLSIDLGLLCGDKVYYLDFNKVCQGIIVEVRVVITKENGLKVSYNIAYKDGFYVRSAEDVFGSKEDLLASL